MMKYRVGILALFAVLAIASAFLLPRLRFAFDFEQFFPSCDPDLAFFREFIKEQDDKIKVDISEIESVLLKEGLISKKIDMVKLFS